MLEARAVPVHEADHVDADGYQQEEEDEGDEAGSERGDSLKGQGRTSAGRVNRKGQLPPPGSHYFLE